MAKTTPRIPTQNPEEDPNTRFRRLANHRAGQAIKALRALAQLGAPEYEKLPEDVRKLENGLQYELEAAITCLRENRRPSVGNIL